jgi:hypothetical protein
VDLGEYGFNPFLRTGVYVSWAFDENYKLIILLLKKKLMGYGFYFLNMFKLTSFALKEEVRRFGKSRRVKLAFSLLSSNDYRFR